MRTASERRRERTNGEAAGFAITERDVEIVRWIGRVGVAEARQVAARWQREPWRQDGAAKGMPASNVYRRLRGLEAQGLLARKRLLHGEPGVFLATVDGLRLAGLDLRARKVSAAGVAHATQATWLALLLEEEFGPERVVTEREVRARDGSAERPAYAIAAGGKLPSGRLRLHFPDFAVEDGPDGRPLAIELELSAKGQRRLLEIVRAYVRARHVGAVRYYVTSASARQVRAAVSEARAESLVEVLTDAPLLGA